MRAARPKSVQDCRTSRQTGEELPFMTLALRGRHFPNCTCCATPGLSRRNFLAGTAATAVADVLPQRRAFAAAPALIDTHHHFYPPEYQKLWLDYEDAHKMPHFPGPIPSSKCN